MLKSLVSSWICGVIVLLIFCLADVPASLSQDAAPQPAPAAAPEAPKVKAEIPLKTEDAKDLENIADKFVILELERSKIDDAVENKYHFRQRYQELMKRNKDFVEAMNKAYGVDPKEMVLDAEAKGFVKRPKPPSQGKPAAVPPKSNVPPPSDPVPAAIAKPDPTPAVKK